MPFPRPAYCGLLLIFLLLPLLSQAQRRSQARNTERALLLDFSYGAFSAAGDFGDRFGGGYAAGLDAHYLTVGPFQFGLMGRFGFGNVVKEDVLAGLRTENGFIIGNQRQPADIQLRHRHWYGGATVGYTLGFGRNARAGLHLRGGLGYLSHRVRVQRDPVQTVAALEGPYEAGYDRLTGGPATYFFVGYQQLALDRRLNFFIGGEVTAGFTRAQRSFNLSTASVPDDAVRSDLLLGVRAGLILPFYFGEASEIYY